MNQDRDDQRRLKLLRRMLSAATLILSLSLAGATEPSDTLPRRPSAMKPNKTAAEKAAAKRTLSTPVKERLVQPDLSPELMHDLPQTSVSQRDEDKLHPAGPVSPVPFLRGIYTGSAKILAQSNGKTRITWMEVTAYCPCTKCCGPAAVGITASGKPVSYQDGAFVAADVEQFPFGTKLRIPGYRDGKSVEVIDKGSAIKGAKIDVFFATHEEAEAWGRQWIPVIVDQ